MRNWVVMGSVSLVLLVSGHSPARRPEKPTADEAQRALEAVNVQARAAYAAARDKAVERAGPVLIQIGDDLTLRYGSVRLTRRVTPPLYHDLKAVGHMVLSLDAMLTVWGDEKFDETRAFELRSHRGLIEKARTAIRERGLSPAQVERQEKILLATDEYVQALLKEGKAEAEQRVAVMRKLRPLLEANNTDAGRGQLDGLHREALAYKERLGDDWKRVRVIVAGSQQPRRDNVAVQYFCRLLGEPGEGLRVVYAESLYDEPKAVALLGTKLLDVNVGTDIWGEPEHLFRDLLGDVAKAYLDELFKK